MLYDLRHADARVKWLVTCLLATFGVTYLFGSWMVGLYAGFTPHSIAVTYGSPEMNMAEMTAAPESTTTSEHAMSEDEMGGTDVYTVDRKLLVQDTHVHMPMYGLIGASLSIVVLGLKMKRSHTYALITLLFAAPWINFTGMWLTKLVSPSLAGLTLLGGYIMAFDMTVVFVLAMWQMWIPEKKGATP
jgi:hypothetical protein